MNSSKTITLGIFAHANAGKTTLTENILHHTGIISSVGRVDSGNTTTDSLNVERERGISVKSALVGFTLGNKDIQLIDTPGHIDFSAEVERSMSVLDCAILVISAADGLEAQTYAIWNNLSKKNIPIIFFINKMDRDGSDFNYIVSQIKENFTDMALPLVRVEKSDSVDINSISDEELFEGISDLDDSMSEKYIEYLEGERKLDTVDVKQSLSKAVTEGKLFPVVGGSTLKEIGIDEVLDVIKDYIIPNEVSTSNDFSGYVYSVKYENGQFLYYVKVLEGALHNRDKVLVGDDQYQTISSIRRFEGGSLVEVVEACKGQIVVLTGIDVNTGAVIGNPVDSDNYHNFVNPLLTMNISSVQGQEEGLIESLKILSKEDPYLNYRYNRKTGKHFIDLMGEVQAEVICNMLKDRFSIDADVENPLIICREKPKNTAEGECSYTGVSYVKLRVEPLQEGSGIVIDSEVSTGIFHKKYQNQIKRLIAQYAKQGLFGWELCDTKISIIDGKFDNVGSESHHFNIAAPLALFRALNKAGVYVMEPICSFSLKIKKDVVSSVSSYLSTNGASFDIKETPKFLMIRGSGCLTKLSNLPVDLHKMTSGFGECLMEVTRYHKSFEVIECNFVGFDPRNETTFVVQDLDSSLKPLDQSVRKKKSKAKFSEMQKERKEQILENAKSRSGGK